MGTFNLKALPPELPCFDANQSCFNQFFNKVKVEFEFYFQHYTELSFEDPSFDSDHHVVSGKLQHQDLGLDSTRTRQRTVSGPSTVTRNRMRTMSTNLDDTFNRSDKADLV